METKLEASRVTAIARVAPEFTKLISLQSGRRAQRVVRPPAHREQCSDILLSHVVPNGGTTTILRPVLSASECRTGQKPDRLSDWQASASTAETQDAHHFLCYIGRRP